jgi:hypothetical protein
MFRVLVLLIFMLNDGHAYAVVNLEEKPYSAEEIRMKPIFKAALTLLLDNGYLRDAGSEYQVDSEATIHSANLCYYPSAGDWFVDVVIYMKQADGYTTRVGELLRPMVESEPYGNYFRSSRPLEGEQGFDIYRLITEQGRVMSVLDKH